MRYTRFQQLLVSVPTVVASLFTTLIVGACAIFGGTEAGDSLLRAKGYQVSPPKNWSSADRNESDQAFRLSSGSIATLTSSCTRNAKAPKDVLTRNLLMGARKVHLKKREKLTVDQGDGLYSSVRASYEDVPMNMELFVLTKDGCIFDFTLISNKELPTVEVGEFKQFIESFRYGKD